MAFLVMQGFICPICYKYLSVIMQMHGSFSQSLLQCLKLSMKLNRNRLNFRTLPGKTSFIVDQGTELMDMLHTYRELFSEGPHFRHITLHVIETGEAAAVKCLPYCYYQTKINILCYQCNNPKQDPLLDST